jgi:DNA modification methylase
MLELNEIYCMDNVEGCKLLDDNSIDLTITSPPYDCLRLYKGYSFDFESLAKELYRVTKKGGVVVWVVGDATVKGSETGTSFKQALYFKEIGFNLHDTMIYKKNGTGACGSNLSYWQAFEYMFVFSKGKIKTVNRLDNGKPRSKGGIRTGRLTADGKQKIEKRSNGEGKLQIRNNIWEYNVGFLSGDDKIEHPAKFPEQLVTDHLLSWSLPNNIILDPFMGSGTTGKCCVLNNRNYIGFEIAQEYVDLANERINKYKPKEV